MRHYTLIGGLTLAVALLAIGKCAQAQNWTDGGWTHYTASKSTSGYVINASGPGVTASAPSGGLLHTWIQEVYDVVLTSAPGWTGSTTVHSFYALSGSVSSAATCSSRFDWATGGEGLAASSPSQDYNTGTVQCPSQTDYTIKPPGGTVEEEVSADTQVAYSWATATATATGNCTYTP